VNCTELRNHHQHSGFSKHAGFVNHKFSEKLSMPFRLPGYPGRSTGAKPIENIISKYRYLLPIGGDFFAIPLDNPTTTQNT
jgi:hypothetical protein